MKQLITRIEIFAHVLPCLLWNQDRYEWHTYTTKGRMRRLRQDDRSWEYRDMTDDELFEEFANFAIK